MKFKLHEINAHVEVDFKDIQKVSNKYDYFTILNLRGGSIIYIEKNLGLEIKKMQADVDAKVLELQRREDVVKAIK